MSHDTIVIPDELAGFSDRSAAIVAGAMLEDLLESLLRKVMVDDLADPLLRGRYAPLGTFAGKIDLATALGHITRAEASDLHRIRKIRNEFSHTRSLVAFEHSPAREHVAALHFSPGVVLSQPTQDARREFNDAVAMLSGFLKARIDKAAPCNPIAEFHASLVDAMKNTTPEQDPSGT